MTRALRLLAFALCLPFALLLVLVARYAHEYLYPPRYVARRPE